MQLRVRATDGVEIAADAFGSPADPSVVLLHGTGQNRGAWAATATALAEAGWHAVTVDLRGHGDSGWSSDGHYETDRFVGDVVAVVDVVGRPAALVGSSLGGRTALVATGEASQPLTSCLVLVETAARLDDSGAARVGSFLRGHLDGFNDLDEVADAIAAYRGSPRRPTDEARLHQIVHRREDGRYHWNWDPRIVVRDGQIVRHRSDSEHERTARAARQVSVPTLLLRGEHSDLVTAEAANHLLGLVPHCEVVEVAGIGHLIAGDRDERLQRHVVEFLGRHRPAIIAAAT